LFLGLRGSPEEIAWAAKEFKVFYQANQPKHGSDSEHYLVDHTAGIFVFDPQGKLRLYVGANGRSVERMVEDVRRLLDS
jgi:protein SCO1/2